MTLQDFLEQSLEFDEKALIKFANSKYDRGLFSSAHGRRNITCFKHGALWQFDQCEARMLVMAEIVRAQEEALVEIIRHYSEGKTTGGHMYMTARYAQSKITAILHKHAETSDDKGGEG